MSGRRSGEDGARLTLVIGGGAVGGMRAASRLYEEQLAGPRVRWAVSRGPRREAPCRGDRLEPLRGARKLLVLG